MALFTKQPDGSLLIETRLDHFLEKWKVAALHDKLVLADQRPAVRTIDDQGVNLTTIHPAMWESVRTFIKPLLKKAELDHPSRGRMCELCGATLKLRRETESAWVFHCEVCETSEIHGKAFVGGVIGSGEREKDRT